MVRRPADSLCGAPIGADGRSGAAAARLVEDPARVRQQRLNATITRVLVTCETREPQALKTSEDSVHDTQWLRWDNQFHQRARPAPSAQVSNPTKPNRFTVPIAIGLDSSRRGLVHT